MVLETEISISSSTVKVKGHAYKRLYLYLPSILTNDSAFPFKEGDKAFIRIENKALIISASPHISYQVFCPNPNCRTAHPREILGKPPRFCMMCKTPLERKVKIGFKKD